jgi:uncharacterized membrane protein HdeD (DUF308 family)
MLVVCGLTSVASAFSTLGRGVSIYQNLLAVVYTFAGVALLVNPSFALTTLSLVLLVYFVLAGVDKIGMGVQSRSEPQWVYYVLRAVVSLVLAGLLFVSYPSTSSWGIGVLFGVNLLVTGVILILVGNIAREGGMEASSSVALGTGPGG